MRQSFGLIYNPLAGAGKKHIEEELHRLKKSLGVKCDLTCYPTQAPGDATVLAKSHGQEHDVLLIGGGDGTINEVINGLEFFKQPIGILPWGTTNSLARELELPPVTEDLASIIKAGNLKNIDLGSANGRYFVLWCGVGLDAHIISRVGSWMKQVLGPAAFEITGIKEIFTYSASEIHIEHDGVQEAGFFVIVSNARLYGGRALFPQAQLDDGLFHVIIVKKPDLLTFFKAYFRVLQGRLSELEDVHLLQTRAIKVTSSAPEIRSQVDGELFVAPPLQITMENHKIPLLIP